MLSLSCYKDLIVFTHILLYCSKKVEILLPLNHRAPYTLSKGRCSLKTSIYMLSLILFCGIKMVKIASLSSKNINYSIGYYINRL